MLPGLVLTFVSQVASAQPIGTSSLWEGGGVTVFENYSYATTSWPGHGPGLQNGTYGISCGQLTPTGHSFGHSALTVHLVVASGSCEGVKIDATFDVIESSSSNPSGCTDSS